MDYASQFFADFADPGGFVHLTNAKQMQKDQYDQNYILQLRALLNQEAAFDYQKQYDKWAQGLAESQDAFSRAAYEQNMAFQRESFDKQYALATSPVSTVVNDAAKVGVNPMAALGQSAGSVSVSGSSYSPSSVPSSDARGSFSASPVSLPNTLSSMISSLGTVGSASISAAQTERDSKRQAALRSQELDIMRDKERHEYELGTKQLDISQQNTDISRDRLTADEAQMKFEQIKARKYYSLQKNYNNFTMNMSNKEFERRVKEFNDELNIKKGQLSAQLSAIRNEKDFHADFVRMKYITNFSNNVTSLINNFFGSPSHGSTQDFVDSLMGFKL